MDNKNQIANLLAKRFIARKDVKAVQRVLVNGDCIYTPHCRGKAEDRDYIGWDRDALLAHMDGRASYGHYLLNEDNQCKLFAFDIDLEKTDPKREWVGWYPVDFPNTVSEDDPWSCQKFNPREAWKDRGHPSRAWQKTQLRSLAGRLAAAIHNELEIPVAAYYSGNKGVHVYGFTGLMDAAHVREGARLVLESMNCWELLRGNNFYAHTDRDPVTGYPNVSIEIFPKQDTMTDKSGLGNLMRVPLGKNLKNPKDPTFFLDLRSPLGELRPVDAEWALSTTSQWSD